MASSTTACDWAGSSLIPLFCLGRIRADGPPTDYFPKHEFEQIVDATYIYQPKGWVECRNQATRLRILILLMRWSGLAISDAVTLERRRLNEKTSCFCIVRKPEILFTFHSLQT